MARFFIDRPIFAWVIAIVIMLAGGISITRLPISRYPTIAPPTVTINATYPGASAKSVEESVTQAICNCGLTATPPHCSGAHVQIE